MTRRAFLAGSLALAATATIASLFGGVRAPAGVEAACPRAAGCADCHAGQMPPTHTPDFFADRHGEAAYAQLENCLGCHERADCDDCHARKTPLWHGVGVEEPQLAQEHRRAHGFLGNRRREDCIACHAQNFHSQCAECHQRTEFP